MNVGKPLKFEFLIPFVSTIHKRVIIHLEDEEVAYPAYMYVHLRTHKYVYLI